MKKGICFAVLAWLCLALTACGMVRLPISSALPSGGDKTPPADVSPPVEEVKTVSYQAEGIRFDIMSDWIQAEGTHMFYTADQHQVYGLNGISALGSYTPQEFFEMLAEYYVDGGQQELLDQSLTMDTWVSSDGVTCQVGKLTGRYGSVLYLTKVVIAPQKNLAITFAAQVREGEYDTNSVWATLDTLCESLTFEIGSQDYITGNTFLVGDGSQLCLQDDGSFRYYRSADDHENEYYEGVYEVWYGQAAMDQIVSMTEYGLTMEELELALTSNMNGYLPYDSSLMDYFYGTQGYQKENLTPYQICLDTFYAVILYNQRLVISPDEVIEEGNDVLYLGYYIPELDMADLVNANAASQTQWTFQEKTQQ